MIEFNVKQHEVKKKNQFEIQQRESSRAKNNLKPGVMSFFFLSDFLLLFISSKSSSSSLSLLMGGARKSLQPS